MKKLITAGLLIICAAAFAQLGADDVFTMRHLNTTVNDSGGGNFLFKNKEYDVQWNIGDLVPDFQLYNNTNSPMRLHWSDSAIVLPNGRTSTVVPGTASWLTRNNAFPPSLIPPRASLDDGFYAVSLMSFDDRLNIAPLFNSPLTGKMSFRIFMSLEINGKKTLREFAFFGQPRPQQAIVVRPPPVAPTVRPPVATPQAPMVRYVNESIPYFALRELVSALSGSLTASAELVVAQVADATFRFTVNSRLTTVIQPDGTSNEYDLSGRVFRHSSGVIVLPQDALALFGCEANASTNPDSIWAQCGDAEYELLRY